MYPQLDLKDKFKFYITKIFFQIIQQSKSKESRKKRLCSPVNTACLEGEVLDTIITDTTVQIINTGVKPIWLFCLGRNPIHGFQMFYLFL